MKEGFKPFILVSGLPCISVTDNGVTFSKSTIVKLGYPRFANLYINEDDKILAIESGIEGTPQAIPFYRENNKGTVSVRWNNKDLLQYLSNIMDWNLDEFSYKIPGVFDYKLNIFEFDLKKAETNKKEKQNLDEN